MGLSKEESKVVDILELAVSIYESKELTKPQKKKLLQASIENIQRYIKRLDQEGFTKADYFQ